MNINIIKIISEIGCFDLQFRRDVRHKRTNSPIYYSWKAQFAIASKIDKEEILREIQKNLGCGRIHYITGTQLRYSVQAINELYGAVVPFFQKNLLAGKKRQDFELWAEAIKIIYKNKGKALFGSPKTDFFRLIEIQKLMQKYKTKKTQNSKWLAEAKATLDSLK